MKKKFILKAIFALLMMVSVFGIANLAQASITKMENLWASSGDDQSYAIYGFTTASAGDVNGDGYADVIVGAQSYDTGNIDAGKVYVYHGSASGLSSTVNWTSTGEDEPNVNYGVRVAAAGDVNGDGFSDVIVGAEGDNGHAGKAFVYHGSAAGLSTTADWTYGESQANAFFGFSVASAGDVNHDGYDDVIVGAYKYDTTNTDAGRAYLFLGSFSGLNASASWTSSGDDQANAWYGRRVASAGDVNNDGYGDVLVGADQHDASGADTGKAYLYLGTDSGLNTSSTWTSSGDNQAGARFGMSVWGDDINNDGYSDIIIGGHQYTTSNSQAGKTYLYLGSGSGSSNTPVWTSSGDDQAEAWYGFSAPIVGDVNGDGYKDILVGAMRYDNSIDANAGKAYLYLGSASGLGSLTEWTVEGDSVNDDPWDPVGGERLGISTAPAGDINGDGKDEFLIGAEGYNMSAGRAWVYTDNANFSISTNSGAESTYSQNVTITVSQNLASAPQEMIFSENSNFSGASWESYASSKSFTLSSGDGTKTIYARFRDSLGNQSKTVSDSIVLTLDSTSPTFSSPNIESGATGVAINSDISFHLADSGSNLNINTLDVTINDNPAITDGSCQSSYACSIEEVNSHDISINPDNDFQYNQEVTIEILVDDNQGNTLSVSWTFTVTGPDINPKILTTSGPGEKTRLWAYDRKGNATDVKITSGLFPASYLGGAGIIPLDQNNNSVLDQFVIFALNNGGPQARVLGLKSDGSLVLKGQMFLFDKKLRDGLSMTSGDFDDDGFQDDVAACLTGNRRPNVKVFKDATGMDHWQKIGDFIAPFGNVGCNLGTFQFDDKADEILVTPNHGKADPKVYIYTTGGTKKKEFMAYPKGVQSGVTASGIGDRIYTTPNNGSSQINVFDKNGNRKNFWWAYQKTVKGNFKNVPGDIDLDGKPELLVSPIGQNGPQVLSFEPTGKWRTFPNFFAFDNKKLRNGVGIAVIENWHGVN